MTEFSLRESPWWLILCLLVSLAVPLIYYFFLYKGGISRNRRVVLSLLRGSAVFIILLLLLSPFVTSSFRSVQKPLIVLAIDNSASLSASPRAAKPHQLREIAEALSDKLQDKAEVRRVTFGKNLSSDTALSATEKETNLSALFTGIDNAFEGRNLAATVLLSDGIYNSGENPLFVPSLSAHPVFCLALGDTTRHKDLALSAVRHNPKVFKGNSTGIRAEVLARSCKGEQVTLTLSENGKLIDSRVIACAAQEQVLSAAFSLTPSTGGIHEYECKVVPVQGEQNLQNNTRKFFIEVVEDRRNILLLADAPHPDIRVFERALSQQEAVKLDVQLAENFKGNFNAYQLVIFHNLPSLPAHTAWMQALQQSRKPALFVIGQKTQTGIFSRTAPGAGFPQGGWLEALPSLNPDFSLFTNEKSFSEQMAEMPPLQALYFQGNPVQGSQVLLYQKQGAVETRMPLLYYKSTGDGKYAYLCGEGIWKWSMLEYKQWGNHNLTQGLIQKSVQYLISEESSEPLQLLYETRIRENENILMDARLFNQSREMVNEPELNVSFTGNKRTYSFTFTKSENGYHLDAGFLAPGKYTVEAQVTLGGKKLTRSGVLVVEPVFAELSDLVANHNLLSQISKKSGGKLFYDGQETALADAILEASDIKPVSFYKKELKELISFPVLLLLLVILLTAEWFLRKQWGTI